MAEQLNLLENSRNERVVTIALHQEMQRSYLEYAMSVIVGRALPDVRDGLKPVQRRILYAMHELGLTPDRPFRKCARVVGDVLGKYHPHGDQAVYDALVRLVQDFTCRYPLLAGHGNFGSVDNDPPAAMRYTETRLAAIGQEGMLGEIGENTVEFIANFDNSQQEPVVLPAQLPFLVLNGCSGIAVGMATNIPPHNLGEVVDGLIALIDRPDLQDAELLDLIPGPDFPTGGEITNREGIQEAYTKGKGSIPLRGVATLEEVQLGRGRHRRQAIVVTELPYQVNKASWIEKVAELVNQTRIEGIVDIRDESDRDGMRVVIELKRESNPTQILQQLYQKTPLQTNFGAILLALVEGQPRQLSLKELLQEFLNFREETLTRRYRHELEQAERRQALVAGLLQALNHLDQVIDILRNARDGSAAKAQLQVQLDLTEQQADAILAMPMRRLTGIERENLEQEAQELAVKIANLQRLLGDRRELLKSLKKDLRSLKRRYTTPRRTRIQSAAEASQEAQQVAESLVESSQSDEAVVLEFTQRGYVRRLTPRTVQRQGALEALDKFTEFEDCLSQRQGATLQQEVLVLTRNGKAYTFKAETLAAPSRRNSKGTPLITLLPEEAQGDLSTIVTSLVLPPVLADWDLIVLSREGRIKRMPLEEFSNLTSRGLGVMKLKEQDELQLGLLTKAQQQIVLATSGGRLLRFEVNDEQLPLMGRSAQGLIALRLRKQEQLVGCVSVEPIENILLVSEKGYLKRTPVNLLPLGSRGDLGNPGFKFDLKHDALAALQVAPPEAWVTVLTDGDRMARLDMNLIPVKNKEGGGDRLLQPKRDEKIVAVTIVENSEFGVRNSE
jgi:DNA gyrase subunit A